jgi:hypothetical protein
MRRNQSVTLTLTVTLALVAAMLLVNASVATSETRADASISAASSRGNASIIVTPQPRLWLYVHGDDSVTDAFSDELQDRLNRVSAFAGITPIETPPTESNHPALAVGITERDILWLPIYGRAQVTVRFAYASDTGNVSWQSEPVRDFVISGDAPVVRIHGKVTIIDTTRGIISRPAYLEHLGTALARETQARLEEELARIESSGR